MSQLVELRHLSMTYSTKSGESVNALVDVSATLEDGEFVTIVGPSGCGKSTLLKLIAGIMAPSEGEIFYDGARVLGATERVGLVFQRPVLLPWRSVTDNVLFPIEMLGRSVREYRSRATELLQLVGLEGFERSYPGELSGGMQQRVSLCRSLIYDPPLLLMDEPFAALDALTREDLGLELLRIWSERRKTILFVTHSIQEAVLLADRVIVMSPRPGRIVASIDITLPRPRDMGMVATSDFGSYANEIRDLISHRATAERR
jgi:NitT/TauT family transport system ATP-binding protein